MLVETNQPPPWGPTAPDLKVASSVGFFHRTVVTCCRVVVGAHGEDSFLSYGFNAGHDAAGLGCRGPRPREQAQATLVFGHIALSQIRRTGESGRGMAIAGLVLGYISIVFWLVILLIP
ncbi:DUF4190 domain-containing protein [Prescottella agglutinans]|uniref:DUF4190 domain-containing protein n=1 Tax=Prescottella agglutinans TaxID=1644129 RepID=UPI00247499E1|nr:DUF4190 domain-containing protein [Prescottella agglutinans]